MSDDALREEVRQLRDKVARLEASDKAGVGMANMKGFQQLNDAIAEGTVPAFARNLQPRWQRNLILATILIGWALIFLWSGARY